jgi:SAM-dependent methyltransferase
MDPRAKIAELVLGFTPAQALAVAAELGIADLVATEPKTAEQLASATGTNPHALFRLLRYLASLGVFRADEHRRFDLTPMASLLRSDTEHSMRPMTQIMGRIAPTAVNHLLDSVRSGKNPFEAGFGQPLFAYLSEHRDEAVLFDAAMNGFHSGETDAVLAAYDFTGISTLTDVGCGNGTVLLATLKRHGGLRGVFFDLPHVVERAEAGIKAAGLGNRFEIAKGDMFEAVPPGADAYHMRHIIHDWPDDACVRIFRNIRRVIPPTGRLLIVEMVVPEDNNPSLAKTFDMVMMLFPPNGAERTEKEYRHLLKSGGFEMSGITPTASPVFVIEARPN